MRVTNIVLYKLGDARAGQRDRFPLASVSPDDLAASLSLQAAASDAINAAKRSGAAVPQFKCVKETREADQHSKNMIFENYLEVNPATLRGKQGDDGVNNLDSLFTVEN